jgi:hypothetical protein
MEPDRGGCQRRLPLLRLPDFSESTQEVEALLAGGLEKDVDRTRPGLAPEVERAANHRRIEQAAAFAGPH